MRLIYIHIYAWYTAIVKICMYSAYHSIPLHCIAFYINTHVRPSHKHTMNLSELCASHPLFNEIVADECMYTYIKCKLIQYHLKRGFESARQHLLMPFVAIIIIIWIFRYINAYVCVYMNGFSRKIIANNLNPSK